MDAKGFWSLVREKRANLIPKGYHLSQHEDMSSSSPTSEEEDEAAVSSSATQIQVIVTVEPEVMFNKPRKMVNLAANRYRTALVYFVYYHSNISF